jgi:hypothetical protein
MIPDEIFTTLFQHAWNLVERADVLLSIRDELHGIEVERQNQSKLNIIKVKTRYLKARGFDGGSKEFNEILLKLRTACYIVVASLSGCRNHEIAFVQSDSCYSTEDDDGVVYWWMRSQSTKTDAGHTEWMIPEAAVKALKVMDRWAKPWQAKITEEIDNRRAIAALDPEIAEARRHVGAVFLGIDTRKGSQVRTLSILGWTNALGTFAKQCGLDWHLSTHQFRRKFANYAARSRFGDLRYLREHFKHWSLDVTLAYALNESQEMALYMEIDEELNTINEGLVKGWLAPDEPLAGGYGRNIVAWRGSEAVNIFKSHKHMVRSVAESTSIRSNGHAWCTADDNLCVGNDLERTRCSGCSNAVIGKTHSDLYQGLYEHLKEILKSDDIGEAGIARVHRDMQRCSSVLKDLGYDVVGNAP